MVSGKESVKWSRVQQEWVRRGELVRHTVIISWYCSSARLAPVENAVLLQGRGASRFPPYLPCSPSFMVAHGGQSPPRTLTRRDLAPCGSSKPILSAWRTASEARVIWLRASSIATASCAGCTEALVRLEGEEGEQARTASRARRHGRTRAVQWRSARSSQQRCSDWAGLLSSLLGLEAPACFFCSPVNEKDTISQI